MIYLRDMKYVKLKKKINGIQLMMTKYIKRMKNIMKIIMDYFIKKFIFKFIIYINILFFIKYIFIKINILSIN